jgi:hypothetical protein
MTFNHQVDGSNPSERTMTDEALGDLLGIRHIRHWRRFVAGIPHEDRHYYEAMMQMDLYKRGDK